MTTAVAGTGMAHVQVALVGDLADFRLEGDLEPAPDFFDPFEAHGMTWTKGLTETRHQTPPAT